MSDSAPSSASIAKRAKIDETDMVNTQASSTEMEVEIDEDGEDGSPRDLYEPRVLAVKNAPEEESALITDIIAERSLS